jgi:glycosyltransferase involved in cell wall biosynthesis
VNVTELSVIRSSLERTKKTLAKVAVAAAEIDSKAVKIDSSLIQIREVFQTSSGSKIRGVVDRTFEKSKRLSLNVEHLQLRCDRVVAKTRNLEIDLKLTTGMGSFLGSSRAQQELANLRAEAEQIKSALDSYVSAAQSWVSELEKFSIQANWSYRVYIAIDRLRTGFDDLGLRDLLGLVYGPHTPPDHRRRALSELLSWAHTSNDSELLSLTSQHMKAYWVSPDRYSGSDRELVLRLEGIRQIDEPADSGMFVALLDASRRRTEDSLLAGANLVSRLALSAVPELGAGLQLAWINAALELRGLEPVSYNRELGSTTFDQLDCELPPGSDIESPEMVSVLVPAFNSAPWLPTAVRGLLKQTWKNIEVIIIDDCSTDDTLAVANSLAATDARIRVLANKVNQGAYASRNYGLQFAHGHLITVHDADDWSHPRKIERQMLAFDAQPKMVANMSRSVRIDPDSMHLFAQYGREILRQNSSSLMFRRNPVFTELGFWDEVKFGADTEYHHRINSRFGLGSAPTINAGLLSFTRFHTESLTGGGKNSTVRGIIGARRDYVRKFSDWHEQMKTVEGGLYLERAVKKRPFVIPTASSGSDSELGFNFVFVANLAIFTPWIEEAFKKVKTLAKQGKTIAVVHVPSIHKPNAHPCAEFETLLSKGLVTRLDREHVATADALYVHTDALQAKNELVPEVRAKALTLILGQQLDESEIATALSLADSYFGLTPALLTDSIEARDALQQLGLGETKVWKTF